jgi:hypothetical protein
MASLESLSGTTTSAILSRLTFKSTPKLAQLAQIGCTMSGSATVEANPAAKKRAGRPKVHKTEEERKAANAQAAAAYRLNKINEAEQEQHDKEVEQQLRMQESGSGPEDALNHVIATGGYDTTALNQLQSAQHRRELLGDGRRVKPRGAAPPPDGGLDPYAEKWTETPETFLNGKASHKKLMKASDPLPRKGKDGFLESVRRAFCKTHSLVAIGATGETYIDFSTTPPSRVLLFGVHFDASTRVWRLDCGCTRPEKDFKHRRRYVPKELQTE